MTKKRRRPRLVLLRYRKKDHVHNLLAAVQRYVHAEGGSVLVIGGIEVQQWDDEPARFKIAVGCLGRQPPKPIKEPRR